jgi:hypothetical protein
VDENTWKKDLLHMPAAVFAQVNAVVEAKVFCCPQSFPQAVHKLCPLVHRFSTGRGAR